MNPFWPNFFIPCFKLNVVINDDLFTVSWLFISFIIIAFVFSDFCETTLRVYYFCALLWFVSYKNLIVGSFLVHFSIFFTLEASMYTCPFIVISNISTGEIYIYDILTFEYVDSLSLISFTTEISISSWSYLIGAS